MTRVVIIGAGPAGSSAAFHLASAGFEVTIIERAAFPRVKVCGEFISPGATEVLEAILPARDLLDAGARRVDRLVLELGDRAAAWELPTPAWAISRAGLDVMLLQRAGRAGARVEQPASVRAVKYADDGVTVMLGDGRSLEAEIVIHADGSGRHDPAGSVPCDERLVGHKCHLRVPGGVQGVRMRAGRGAYVGTIQVEGDLATCALVARKARIAEVGGDADEMLRRLWPGYDAAWRAGEWKSCGVARSRYIRPGHPRAFRIGNAAAAVDPIGGEGIGLALWAGTELARLLAASASDIATAQRLLAVAYSRRLRTRLPACRAAGELLMREGLVRALWPLTHVPWLVMRPWYAMTGKPVRSTAAGA